MLLLGRSILLTIVLALLLASSASAATRYAAPAGSGVDPCGNPAEPCNVYVAADSGAPGTTVAPGDVVELAPGTYSEAAGDLGPFNYVAVQEITVRGEPGESRPLIRLQGDLSNTGAFEIFEGGLVSHVEIENEAEGGYGVTISEGTLDNAIVRAPASPSITCNVTAGTVRSSVCLNEAGGIALGASLGTGPGTFTTSIRNTTAIASGLGSRGVEFFYGATDEGLVANVDAKGLIAKGEGKDVVARGKETSASGKGASVTITLDHSDYSTVEVETSGSGGSASVTPAGTNANITAAPLLAPDHIHQLPGSPTINKGAVDGASNSLDIDNQQRTLGPAPDIGADELANPTTTTISCSSYEISIGTIGAKPICTVTVEDVGALLTQPSGEILLEMDPPGGGYPRSCTLAPDLEASASCLFMAEPTVGAGGTQTLTASYAGDSGHDGSQTSTVFSVVQVSQGGTGGGASSSGSGGGNSGGGNSNPAPATQLKQHPAMRTTKRLAKFTFGSNESGSRFECKLDHKPFKDCSSPFKKKVKLGSHKFQVRAVDAQGAVDATPAVFRWRVLAP